MRQLLFSASGVVGPESIDMNGHMNVAPYLEIFDRGINELFSRTIFFGSDMTSDLTMVASRIYVQHRNELLEGESWELYSGFITLSPTSVTTIHRLIGTGLIRAVCDIKSVPFLKSRRTKSVLSLNAIERANSYVVPGMIDKFSKLDK